MQSAIAGIWVNGGEEDYGGVCGQGGCGCGEQFGEVSERVCAGKVEDIVYCVGIEGYGIAGGHCSG